MDYDKLIEQLRWWAEHCDRTNYGCQVRTFLLDAATAIETLRADLARVTAERDAATHDLELFATCDTCKFGEMEMAYDCLGCDHASRWKWRGIQED